MKRFAVIDFETTGLSAGLDRIIEVGAVLVENDEIVGTFSELMNPGVYVPGFITDLTGISNAMIRGKPRPEAVMPRLRAFLGDHICVAHNASFDQRFYTAEMELAGEQHDRMFLCSMLLARRLVQKAPSHKLGVLVHHLRIAEIPGMRAHRALNDVLMTCELWKRLTGMLRERLNGSRLDPETIKKIARQPKASVESYINSLAVNGHPKHQTL